MDMPPAVSVSGGDPIAEEVLGAVPGPLVQQIRQFAAENLQFGDESLTAERVDTEGSLGDVVLVDESHPVLARGGGSDGVLDAHPLRDDPPAPRRSTV